MKKFLLAAVIAVISFAFAVPAAQAQQTKMTVKTITAADTVSFTSVPSKIKAFQYQYTETSGTTAGKVYFEGTITGALVTIDSLVLSDVATAQTKVFAVTATNYINYRLRNTNTSSATGVVRAAWLRRVDE